MLAIADDFFLLGPDIPRSTLNLVGGTTIWLPTTSLKTGPCGVMLNDIKDLSVSFSSLIGFEVEWHCSWFHKEYQSQGHGFESQECHYERGIVEGTTIWLLAITLKIDQRSVMLKTIKELSVSFSSSISLR